MDEIRMLCEQNDFSFMATFLWDMHKTVLNNRILTFDHHSLECCLAFSVLSSGTYLYTQNLFFICESWVHVTLSEHPKNRLHYWISELICCDLSSGSGHTVLFLRAVGSFERCPREQKYVMLSWVHICDRYFDVIHPDVVCSKVFEKLYICERQA